MKRSIGIFVLLSMFILTSPVFGDQWELDHDHAEIRFQVKHILTTTSGAFNEFEGEVEFNPEMPEKAKISFTVEVNSIDTNHGKRDNHLKSKDFFNASKFPKMTFKSTKIFHIKNNLFQAEGMMTIKDVSKKMIVDFEFINPVPHPFKKNKKVAGFKSRFTISRLDYKVGDGKFVKMGVVGEMVNVELAGEALTDK